MENRKIRTGVPALVAVAALLVVSAGAAEKIQYKLELERGQSYYVRVISDSNIAQEIMGQESVTEVSAGFGYSFDVNEVDDKGNGWVDCTVDWVKFTQKSPMMEVVYDSAKQASPVPAGAQSVAAFLGESFTAKITPQGLVEELRGLERLRKSIEKKIPEGSMEQQMLQDLDDEQLADSIRDYFLNPMAVYPDKPVGIGDSWSRTSILKTQPFIYENKWTLKDRKAGLAIIEADTTMKSKPEAVQKGAVEMKFDMSGKRIGQIEINESTGQIIRSKMTQDSSGQMDAGSTKINLKTHGVTTFEMTERKADVVK